MDRKFPKQYPAKEKRRQDPKIAKGGQNGCIRLSVGDHQKDYAKAPADGHG